MAFEEIHWRTHMGGWLPGWLRPAARHHLLHHVRGTERFNVFLPFFDWVIDSISGATSSRGKTAGLKTCVIKSACEKAIFVVAFFLDGGTDGGILQEAH